MTDRPIKRGAHIWEGLLTVSREGVEGWSKENYEQHSTGMFIQS